VKVTDVSEIYLLYHMPVCSTFNPLN